MFERYIIVVLMLTILSGVKAVQSWFYNVTHEDIGYDDIKGLFQISRLPFNPHQEASCYQYELFSRFNSSEVLISKQFCYPSIMITGHFKCSTSALFGLIGKADNVVTTQEKEQCIGGNLLEYFNKLPGPEYGLGHVLSGCLSLHENMKVARVLRRPKTHYILLTRDFANLMWSSYNFWCNPAVEYCSIPTQWVEPGKQNRSAELFHNLVESTLEGPKEEATPMFYIAPMSVCTYGHAAYLRMISQMWSMSSVFKTLILASEELDHNLMSTVKLLTKALQLNFNQSVIDRFSEVRYNTQASMETKGAQSIVEKSQYVKNVYAASNFEPLRNSTRQLLDECWLGDCQITSYLTGYNYTSCAHKPLPIRSVVKGKSLVSFKDTPIYATEEFSMKSMYHKIQAYKKYIAHKVSSS